MYSQDVAHLSRLVRKITIGIGENKDADQLHGNREADQRLCFRYYRKVQSLFFLNPKLQASGYLLWLYSLVCVGPVQKPLCLFSHEAAHLYVYTCRSLIYNGTFYHKVKRQMNCELNSFS